MHTNAQGFWDKVPTDKVVSGVVKDTQKAEKQLLGCTGYFTYLFSQICTQFIIVTAYSSWWIWICIVISTLFSYRSSKYYRKCKKQIEFNKKYISSPVSCSIGEN